MAEEAITDGKITSKVTIDLAINGFERDRINVETNDGIVAISGEIDQADMRDKAEQIARQQPGVRDVEVNLVVPTE